jgi:hypothetical protein
MQTLITCCYCLCRPVHLSSHISLSPAQAPHLIRGHAKAGPPTVRSVRDPCAGNVTPQSRALPEQRPKESQTGGLSLTRADSHFLIKFSCIRHLPRWPVGVQPRQELLYFDGLCRRVSLGRLALPPILLTPHHHLLSRDQAWILEGQVTRGGRVKVPIAGNRRQRGVKVYRSLHSHK